MSPLTSTFRVCPCGLDSDLFDAPPPRCHTDGHEANIDVLAMSCKVSQHVKHKTCLDLDLYFVIRVIMPYLISVHLIVDKVAVKFSAPYSLWHEEYELYR